MNERLPARPAVRRFLREARGGFGRRSRRGPDRTAIGYLRTDLAAPDLARWEPRIRATATTVGYDLLGTLMFPAAPAAVPNHLRLLVTELAVDAVLCPTFAHLDDQLPAELLTVTDLIILDPPITYCRRDARLLE